MWAVSSGISSWIVDVGPYEACRVAGLVERLTVDPVQGSVDATITDGTASIIARWSTCRPPRLRVAPGSGVVLRGIAILEESGLVVVEPTLELVPFPAVA